MVTRCLCGFGEDEELHFEAPLDGFQLEELKAISGCDEDDPDMYGVYDVPAEKLPEIESRLGVRLDPRLEYTIEAFAD